MAFFNSAVTVLQTLVIALGAGLGIWGAINLLEGYGNDKGEMTHRVPIGTSAAGNIQRLDNALAGIPARLEKAEQQLDNLRSQQEAAQTELGKPFPQEAELAEKSARLAKLDALLNMDDRGNDDADRERTTEKPSVLAELRDRAGRIPPVTHRDDEEVAL